MLYEITVDGTVDTVVLLDFVDATSRTDGASTVLRCRVQDSAGLSGVVVLLHDVGLRVREVRAVPDVETF
jgi:hypothetical protein